MTIWLTSDHHFGHVSKRGGIIQYCNRPFNNIEEHDQSLISAWNSIVGCNDTIYYLGDLTLGKSLCNNVFGLNGNIFVLSNPWHHDGIWLKKPGTKQLIEFGLLTLLPPVVVLEPKEAHATVPIIMCHYPFEVWDRKHYGAIHFHGHSHGELHRVHNRLDVGVDMAYKLLGSYRPFSLHEAISLATGYYDVEARNE